MTHTHDPCIIVIFGATGDLAHRKLLPALYHLDAGKMLHPETLIVAFARKAKTSNDYAREVYQSIENISGEKIKPDTWKRFQKRILYHTSDFEDLGGYISLRKTIKELCKTEMKNCNTIFYLAASPHFFEIIINNIRKSKLAKKANSWKRVVFEKPFGNNLRTAKTLNNAIKKVFSEKQIYRIDHYLGKELVQNIMVLRFANILFEPIWNSKFIDNVQITVAEDIGIENRGNYYDKAGALRDMVQNHMMHLVAFTAMDAPKTLTADHIRSEKVKALHSLHSFTASQVKSSAVRGQYSSGTLNGKKVNSFCKEPNIAHDSTTETFVALKLQIDNKRWKNVPFYLRTGKRLKEKVAEINIVFKKTPHLMFGGAARDAKPNALVIRIQPHEGVSLQFSSKVPGRKISIEPVRMDFCHACTFGHNTPEAYERLLHDVIVGDQTLFTRWDEVKYAWKIVDKIAAVWKKDPKVFKYKPGSWGPVEADHLLIKDGREWEVPLKPIYSDL